MITYFLIAFLIWNLLMLVGAWMSGWPHLPLKVKQFNRWTVLLAWYDMWIGAYFDVKKQRVYFVLWMLVFMYDYSTSPLESRLNNED